MYTNNTTFAIDYVASTLTVVQSLAITTARQSVSSYAYSYVRTYDRVGKTSVTIPRVSHLRGMVLLSHFASCFSCTICTFLHRIRNRFEAVPGAVVLSHVFQEEIRVHFADQEMAPLTSQEVGFLLKDAFGDRYHKTRSREGNIYVGLRLKRLSEGHDHEPQIHPGHDHQPSSYGPSQAAKRVRT